MLSAVLSILFSFTSVTIVYGSVASMLCAITAIVVGAFFLTDPIFSFYMSDPREAGELMICWYRIDRS